MSDLTNTQIQALQLHGKIPLGTMATAELIGTDPDGDLNIRITKTGNCEYVISVAPVVPRTLPDAVLLDGKLCEVTAGGPIVIGKWQSTRRWASVIATLYAEGPRGGMITLYLRERGSALQWQVFKGRNMNEARGVEVEGIEEYAKGALADYLAELEAVSA